MKRPLWIAVLTLAALVVLAAVVGGATGGGSRSRFPSSFAGEPEGILAFRRLLEGLGIPVSVRTTPWDDLETLPPRGVLVVTTPIQREVDFREAESLGGWIRRGGALLVVDDATDIERSERLDRVLKDAGVDGRRPVPTLSSETLMPARPALAAARGTPLPGSGTDLSRLMLHETGGLDAASTGLPLAIDAEGDVLAARASLRRGRVVRVFGPLLANDNLLAGDDLVFALRLVEDLRGKGPVLFDEYHHGHGGLFPASRRLDRGALALASLQILAAVGLYAVARGVRFGPARISPRPARRSSLEFVLSMSALYRRARARRHVLDSEIERFSREARHRWQLGPELPLRDLAGAIAARAELPPARVRRPLLSADQARYKADLGEREMVARAAEMARLEEEVFGAR